MIDWQDIVNLHREMVWRIAYRLLGNEADAADCFQDTFVSALQLSQRESVRHWPALLRRVATSRALDILRRRIRQRDRSETWCPDLPSCAPDDAPDRRLDNKELCDQLRWALAHLPEDQAQVFCLRHLEGLSYRRIARQTGQKTGAVGVILHRARKRLQELLSPALAEQHN